MSQHFVNQILDRIEKYQDKTALKSKTKTGWDCVSWKQMGERIEGLANNLLNRGLKVQDAVGIWSNNLPEWTIADLALQQCRAVSVPLYPSSTSSQAEYIINDAKMTCMFIGDKAELKLALPLLDKCESLQSLIVFSSTVTLPDDPRVVAYTDLLDFTPGSSSSMALAHRIEHAKTDDLVTLIYTSGTTGEPKGVMLDYANIQAALALNEPETRLEENDVSLAFLPLSHVFERIWTFNALFWGAENTYLKDPARIQKALTDTQPTVMCAVPRLYEKIHTTMMNKVENAPEARKKLFHWAIGVGKKRFAAQQAGTSVSPLLKLQHMLADKLVFTKLRAVFGGKVRFFPCSGAKLDDEVNLFFQAIGIHLKYGYGMTETVATVSCYSKDFKLGSIGSVLPGIEVKLGAENEILIKSPTVMRGYFNKPEETANTFDGEWLKTGDAGAIDENGYLYITDRLKDLMKTECGKYIAPQLIEGTLGRDRFIEQVAVFADARKYASALIVPAQEAIEEHAKTLNLKYESYVELLKHTKIVELFDERVKEMQKELAKFEQVKKFKLMASPFTNEKGELTPTLKLKRKVIQQRYSSLIESMYSTVKKGKNIKS
ncbi:long-chain fatty acid--CoA ligase [Moritella sp. Urea-trap-13]|uniref:AMP-dependent synthetase/ligase n=1 Tax=Moritella sp. Urea-trap-13 TaxID=2058327 RepID=UPI000C3393C5|nr:long-chain fatty acid--CoA ligase [Moritella sp. Urea-trap-13]PKH07327.1 long-chain fatty acid--CoA ligase [Moritella sp. Urea-trap-13]